MTEKAAPKKKVADVLKDEATEVKTAEVVFRGETYTVNINPDDWDVEVQEAFEDGTPVRFVRGLLGLAQWNQVKAQGLKMRDMKELTEALHDAIGVAVGESES